MFEVKKDIMELQKEVVHRRGGERVLGFSDIIE
jgi:hypothetical protein